MSKNGSSEAITATAPPAAEHLTGQAQIGAAAKPVTRQVHPLRVILRPIASLQLTVYLLGGCMLLVLWGTLAQVDAGINIVVANYFRSIVAWVPLRVVLMLQVPAVEPWTLTVPFPGGWALGTVLMANLLAAHALRFRTGWKQVGVWTIHVGIVLLMLGELLTGLQAIEYKMVIEEGKSASFLEDHHQFEMAFIDISDPAKDKHIVIPDGMLKKGARINHADLPVNLEVLDYMHNSALSDDRPDPATNLATQGTGTRVIAERRPPASGVDSEALIDLPSAYVKFLDKQSGKQLGVWLISPLIKDQRAEIAGKPYELTLRFKRTLVPYKFQLTKFTHDVYPGTDKPKDYRSHVHVSDPETGTERDVEIYMNTPLYFRGKTFYQSGFLDPRQGGMRGTILQVVENPAWRLPYASCALVSLGMLVHFGIHLNGFMRTQKPKSKE